MLAVAQDLGQKVADDSLILIMVLVGRGDLSFSFSIIRFHRHWGDGQRGLCIRLDPDRVGLLERQLLGSLAAAGLRLMLFVRVEHGGEQLLCQKLLPHVLVLLIRA